jgi:hypothetical protein
VYFRYVCTKLSECIPSLFFRATECKGLEGEGVESSKIIRRSVYAYRSTAMATQKHNREINLLVVLLLFWLRAGRSGDRIPVGARFFAHVQTGPEAHPASCTMGIGSFPGVKRPGRGADHPPPSSADVKKE